MKHFPRFFLLLILAFSCNNEESPNPIDDGEPAVTEVGIPTGPAITKEIGPEGGSISSADGKLDITIPAGAVATQTLFSVQPVTNFCPGGIDAYDLLPEGMTFSNPVTLTFHYTDDETEGNSTDFLGIAFQGSDKVWYRMPSTIDLATRTITTKATHFTNWTRLSQLRIEPTSPVVPEIEVNETLDLVLAGASDIAPKPSGIPSPDPSEDDLPTLPIKVPFKATWYVNGVQGGNANVGTIALSGNNIDVVYHAPASPPANNPVTITAELTEFKAWDFVNKKKKSFNKVILFKRVRIGREYNFHVKMELNDNDLACVPDQTYQDEAEMDVHVKNGVVTISNIVNQDAVITPGAVTTGNCTLTCNGDIGQLNVVSGEGSIVDTPAERYLYLTMNVAGAVGPGSTLECGTDKTTTPPRPIPNQGFITFFVLKDSTQTKDLIFKWTLTPD